MKNRHASFKNNLLYLFAAIISLLFSCEARNTKTIPKEMIGSSHVYKSIFGQEYTATGIFLIDSKDSVESKLWYYTNLTRPLVLYGNYSDGMPEGNWHFVLSDGTDLSSQWSLYKNELTACEFSIPFTFKEIFVDSSYFKLTTMNDSLGKISIIVGVSDTVIKDENLAKFGPNSEIGLREQGYTFNSNRREINIGETRYFFTEYYMKDSTNKNVKLYNLYGYLPSKKRFIEFTLFHDGPKEDLVKIIFSLIGTSLYVHNERFINPYLN